MKKDILKIIILLLFLFILNSCSQKEQKFDLENFDEDFIIKTCNNFNHEEIENKCIFEYAFKENNINICNYIENEELKIACKNIFLEKKNACDNVNINYKNLCYNQLAYMLSEEHICDNIDDSIQSLIDVSFVNQIDSCKYQIGTKELDPQFCFSLDENSFINNKIQCLRKIAKELKDESICNFIDDIIYIDRCKKDINLIKIISEKDIDVCITKVSPNNREECVTEIAKIEDNYNLCFKLDNPNDCLFEFMIQGKYKGECKEEVFNRGFYVKTLRIFCLNNLASATKNIDWCFEIEEPEDEIFNDNYIDRCIKNVAMNYFDEDLCEKISDEYEKDNCYEWISYLKEDYSICDYIHNDEIKKYCLKN